MATKKQAPETPFLPERIKNYNHVDLLHEHRYLKGADLRGKAVKVVIEAIDPEHELVKIDGTKEVKPTVKLQGKKRLWVLNKTNAKTIEAIHGKNPIEWIGKEIVLHAIEIRAFGKLWDAIRVKAQSKLAERIK